MNQEPHDNSPKDNQSSEYQPTDEIDWSSDQTQSWQPPRGKGFKVAVWAILAMIAIGSVLMLLGPLLAN